jgi:hypothetical protein
VWGAFRPEADVVVRASGPIRLVARSGAGTLLAGPTVVSPEFAAMSFAW